MKETESVFPLQHPVGDDQAFKPDSPEPYIARDARATNTPRRSDPPDPADHDPGFRSPACGSSSHMAIKKAPLHGPARARAGPET